MSGHAAPPKAAPAPAAAPANNAPAGSPPASLAELIYVELVGRAFLRVENAAVIKPDPAELVKLSLQLAETFHAANKAYQIANAPKEEKGFDMNTLDVASWMK